MIPQVNLGVVEIGFYPHTFFFKKKRWGYCNRLRPFVRTHKYTLVHYFEFQKKYSQASPKPTHPRFLSSQFFLKKLWEYCNRLCPSVCPYTQIDICWLLCISENTLKVRFIPLKLTRTCWVCFALLATFSNILIPNKIF